MGVVKREVRARMSQSTGQHSSTSGASDMAPVSDPQVPPRIGAGHPEYNFVQSVMEMQKHLGEVNSSVKSLNDSINNQVKILNESIGVVSTKVDSLVDWKNKILGGAIALGAALAGLSFVISQFFTYFDISPKQPTASEKSAPSADSAKNK